MHSIKKILISILTWEARLIIRKYKPFIVAVTGSVGKTSTKDAIYCAIQDQRGFVRKSEKSMNSEIGLPLTIIGVPNAWHSLPGWWNNIVVGFKQIIFRSVYPDCLVLEIGADHPGDIKNVCKWLKPSIAVLTKISDTPVHVEFFKSPEEVFEEKIALAKAVKKGGTVVLFADDHKVDKLAEELKGNGIKIITYGTSPESTVCGVDLKVVYSGNETGEIKSPIGISFSFKIEGKEWPIILKGVLGRPYMYPLLSAIAIGHDMNVDIPTIIKSFSEYEPPRGRMRILEGVNDSILIDDTYNSSPDAAVSALETLRDLDCTGDKIAVLGDMMELGKYAGEEHRKIGDLASKIVKRLILVGPRSGSTYDEALKNGMPAESMSHFDSSDHVFEYLSSIVKAGDIVLIKGSQSMRMEKIVKALLKEPQKADRLLVRQENEWLRKV
ncbi:MAG: UDP-N-acetylmuramoyl-tripeptide--D-alanyl-D-alanine ligase [Candidatus Paceibacterota bacterium]|jgi:UDP-N-acetylmuramoyl-tripeptide--D-alanyl-D-alanine ligase